MYSTVIPFKVASTFTDEGGKFGDKTLDSYIITEFKYLLTYIKHALPYSTFLETQGKPFFDFISTLDP